MSSADLAHGSDAVARYYRFHAPIYDLTRWSFLFGREKLLRRLVSLPAPSDILEIGCGTGRNLAFLAQHFPAARLTGVDLSEHMLAEAEARPELRSARVRLERRIYSTPLQSEAGFDTVLFSYSLSMMNPGWDAALKAAGSDLKAGGKLAVVDFGETPLKWFQSWMWKNHVRLDGHLVPELKKVCPDATTEINRAYLGAWKYFLFVGTKP